MSAELLTPDAVLVALVHHQGHENGASARQLCLEICGLYVVPADERRLRAVIEQLRRDGHPICGRPETGYFHATTAAELDQTLEFLFNRAMTSISQIAAMKRVSVPDLRGQLRLPVLTHPLTAESTTERET